jgi:hypothetical protein
MSIWHKNVKNFADKRDKGFPLPIPSRPSLHGSWVAGTKKKDIFLSGYFGCRRADEPCKFTKKGIFDPNLIPLPERGHPYNAQISSGFSSSI